jgi:hypothetical protein
MLLKKKDVHELVQLEDECEVCDECECLECINKNKS